MDECSLLVYFLALLLLTGCAQPPAETEAIKPAEQPPVAPVSPVDRWHVDKSENELDHTIKSSLNDGELYVRCSPKFEGYIVPHLTNLGGQLDSDADREQLVRFRIDKQPLRVEPRSISSDFSGLFLPTRTLRQVIRAKQLVVEYKPGYVQKETMTLDLSGLEEAAKRAGCIK
jgi:hypothetical protein